MASERLRPSVTSCFNCRATSEGNPFGTKADHRLQCHRQRHASTQQVRQLLARLLPPPEGGAFAAVGIGSEPRGSIRRYSARSRQGSFEAPLSMKPLRLGTARTWKAGSRLRPGRRRPEYREPILPTVGGPCTGRGHIAENPYRRLAKVPTPSISKLHGQPQSSTIPLVAFAPRTRTV